MTTWRTCARCGDELMPGEVCPCPVVAPQLAWQPPGDVAPFRQEFVRSRPTAVGEVRLADAGKLGQLVWDLVWLSGQHPWRNAGEETPAGEEGAATVAFFGRFEGRPFVLHDLRGRGPVLYVVGAPDLPGQDVLDAVFAALQRRPWYGHAEPALLM